MIFIIHFSFFNFSCAWSSLRQAGLFSCSADLVAPWHVRSQSPDQGLNPHPLHWKGFLSTGPQGKSPRVTFEKVMMIELNLCFCLLSDMAQNYSIASKRISVDSKYHLSKQTFYLEMLNTVPCRPCHVSILQIRVCILSPASSPSLLHFLSPSATTGEILLFNLATDFGSESLENSRHS